MSGQLLRKESMQGKKGGNNLFSGLLFRKWNIFHKNEVVLHYVT